MFCQLDCHSYLTDLTEGYSPRNMTYYHTDIAGNVIDSEGNSTRSVLNQSSQWQLVGINLHRASTATAWKKSTCLYACIWVRWGVNLDLYRFEAWDNSVNNFFSCTSTSISILVHYVYLGNVKVLKCWCCQLVSHSLLFPLLETFTKVGGV